MAKRQKSNQIKSTDGRKHNKRLPPKVQINGSVTTKPARMNEAKKSAIRSYAKNAIKKVFGSEEEAMISLAQQAKDGSLGHMKLLLEYGYDKPENVGRDGDNKKAIAPVINFYSQPQPLEEHTIDIDAEEVDEEEDE